MAAAGTTLTVTELLVGRPSISAAIKFGLAEVGAEEESLPPGFFVASDFVSFVGLGSFFGFFVAAMAGEAVDSGDWAGRVAAEAAGKPVDELTKAVGVDRPLSPQAVRTMLPNPNVEYLIKLRRDIFDIIGFFLHLYKGC